MYLADSMHVHFATLPLLILRNLKAKYGHLSSTILRALGIGLYIKFVFNMHLTSYGQELRHDLEKMDFHGSLNQICK